MRGQGLQFGTTAAVTTRQLVSILFASRTTQAAEHLAAVARGQIADSYSHS